MWKKKFDKVLAKYGSRMQAGRYGLGLQWTMQNSNEWLNDDEYVILYNKLLYKYRELMDLMLIKGWYISLKALAHVVPEEQLEEIAKELMGE